MWWSEGSRSRVLVVAAAMAAAAALSGCGYQPIYARGGVNAVSAVGAEQAAVRIAPIDDRLGQELRNALLVRLSPQGEPANPRYILTVKLNRNEAGLGFRKDSYATLGELRMTAGYALDDDEEGLSQSGAEETVVSFDYLGPRYASVAMERDASSRAVNELADRIANRVGMALSGKVRWRKPGERSPD